ncbi:uncharacterized protein F5147DRAFT_650871 [Suillus discolor]|uniref:Uncharacterized protein n=1 Tax=Suillus discolor TaxID=1912936 RepID=A0A9P7JVV2_9AGAM|nr:uncharacterized protein F5147DRAFT_650871 [Suillus discolor]KAG2112217.1 hypothetical protein F5147DRAFT_650871 [Suillus discolor]
MEELSLQHYEPEQDYEEKLGKLKIKVGGEAEPAKSVQSSQDWSVAYSLFARAMHFAFPHRIDEIDNYGNFIHQKFAQNISKYHSHVIAFNKAVRKRVSRRRDLQLSDFDQFSDLYEGHFLLSGRCVNEEAMKRSGVLQEMELQILQSVRFILQLPTCLFEVRKFRAPQEELPLLNLLKLMPFQDT